jgi:prepilin signal peptidase PulO-like enzyme (type II secretory pathway)
MGAVSRVADFSGGEVWQSHALTWIAIAFLFMFGLAFGSYLNVIVFRWPRGMPAGNVGSRCPGCGIAIPKRDNIPVLSFVLLGGRCQCREERISIRYPLVEFAVGLMTIALFWVEVCSGGRNLPYRSVDVNAGNWTYWFPKADLLWTFASHWTAVYVLFGMALIRWDGRRIPWQLPTVALAVASLAAIFGPGTSAWFDFVGANWARGDDQSIASRLAAAVGPVLGALSGLGWSLLAFDRDPHEHPREASEVPSVDWSMVVFGAGLGFDWTPVSLSIISGSMLIFVGVRRIGILKRVPLSAVVLVAALVVLSGVGGHFNRVSQQKSTQAISIAWMSIVGIEVSLLCAAGIRVLGPDCGPLLPTRSDVATGSRLWILPFPSRLISGLGDAGPQRADFSGSGCGVAFGERRDP